MNGQFIKDFNIWYKEVINEKVKSKIDNSQDPSKVNSLLQAPIPYRPFKKGYVFKLGGNVKNWKRRYLVAYNQRDNYHLKYYEDSSLTRLKGEINCFG